MEHAALVEWDADACATLRAAGMSPVYEGDVRDLDAIAEVCGDVDALWSSFPCQAFSSAGKRKGANDERNGWPWTVAAIDRFRPRWFMGENVTGLLQHRGDCDGGNYGDGTEGDGCPGCYFHRVIRPALEERFPVVSFRVLDAAAYGVPQHRRRVFIVAGPRAIRWPDPTHGPPTTQRSMFGPGLLPYVTVRDALNLDATIYSAGETGEGRPTAPTSPTATVSTKGTMYAVAQGRSAAGDEKHPAVPVDQPMQTMGTRGNTYLVAHDPRHPPATPDEPAPTVRSGGDGHSAPPMWLETRAATEPERLDRPSPCVAAVEGKGSNDSYRDPAERPKLNKASDALWLATGRRRLTVEECQILMGWPVDHPLQGTKTSRYRQVGNGVCPQVSEAIGRALLAADMGTP